MGLVCITENGALVGINGGYLEIRHIDKTIDQIPKETIDGISVFGQTQLTTSCIQFCLYNNVPVGYFSMNGTYRGTLKPTLETDIKRLKKQIKLCDNEEFCIDVSRKLLHAKIHNQLVIAKRFIRHSNQREKFNEQLFRLRECRRKVLTAQDKFSLIGYEGIAAKSYFEIIESFVPEKYHFTGRSRPAKDVFNALLNLGYSVLSKEISGQIEGRGLTAFAGFLHEDRKRHATLASDLIEEWRAVIVDSVSMKVINSVEITENMYWQEDNQIVMSNELIKIFLKELEYKMHSKHSYLPYLNKEVSFREAIWYQIDRLGKMIDAEDMSIYTPIMIR